MAMVLALSTHHFSELFAKKNEQILNLILNNPISKTPKALVAVATALLLIDAGQIETTESILKILQQHINPALDNNSNHSDVHAEKNPFTLFSAAQKPIVAERDNLLSSSVSL